MWQPVARCGSQEQVRIFGQGSCNGRPLGGLYLLQPRLRGEECDYPSQPERHPITYAQLCQVPTCRRVGQ